MLTSDHIQSVPIFAGLPVDELAVLANQFSLQRFSAQAELIHEGSTSDALYVVLNGDVEIVKSSGTSDERVFARRGPGTLLGEMSLFSSDGMHSASVRAIDAVEVLAMQRQDFEALLNRQPGLAYKLVLTMSKRLVQSENETIIELRQKNERLEQAYAELKRAQEQLIERERLERELEIAHQIQNSILPSELPEIPGYEIGVRTSPAHAVGGDFFDFIPLGDQRMGIVVGDVSDKGIPAALFMSMVYSQIRTEARHHSRPGAVLTAVNRMLREIDVTRMYVTVIYGILDTRRHTFEFARAGHPMPMILDNTGQRSTIAEKVGQPLGMLSKPRLDLHTISIPPGGSILLYSDGITEAANHQDLEYEDTAFLQDVRNAFVKPAQMICDEIFNNVLAYTQSKTQQDDITLLCIKHRA